MKALIPSLVSVVALLFAVPARSADTEKTPQEIENLARDLVLKLGHPKFREREAASQELANLGLGALKAIDEGRKNPILEIRARCELLYPKVRTLDLKRRIEELAADKETRIANNLPLGAAYEKICGKDENARKFFIELCESQLQFLDDAVTDPKAMGEAYFNRCVDLANRTKNGGFLPVTAQEILAVLLIGSDDKIGTFIDEATSKQPDRWYDHPLSPVFFQPVFQNAFTDANTGSMFRKVTFEWAKRRNDLRDNAKMKTQYCLVKAIPQIAQQQAGRFVLDKETIEFMFDSAVSDYKQETFMRGEALTALNSIVKEEHAHFIEEKLFKIETKLQDNLYRRVNGKLIVIETQIRDYALAICVRLSGQKYSDYDFGVLGAEPNMIDRYWNYCGFTSDETRKAAFKKYAEWRKANPMTKDEPK
jgi:hypothetical protein